MKKDAFYFSHDANSQDDPKCMLLIDRLGMEGYGIFWALIERLRCEKEYKLNLNIIPSLSRRWATTPEKVFQVLKSFDLFSFEDDFFFSERLLRSMKEKTEKASKNAQARWTKHTDFKQVNATALQPHATALQTDANAMQNDAIKEKKRKEKERKEIIINEPIVRKINHLVLTLAEENKLIESGYTKNQINSILDNIENYKKNTNYTSLYLTAKKWLEKEKQSNPIKQGAIIHNLEQNKRILDELNNF